MRLWSIHPQYLDSKGLVALWREALLAKRVLEEKTKGYKNHPQLERFKKAARPLDAVDQYLYFIYKEAVKREYNFDSHKIDNRRITRKVKLKVTNGQIDYEIKHLITKLKKRDPAKLKELRSVLSFKPHPLFRITKGNIEKWEVIK